MHSYVIARTARRRPTLMHAVLNEGLTKCGLDISHWSRAYFSAPITVMLCRRCEASR